MVHASLGGERIVVAAALLSSMTLQVSHIDDPGPSWPRPKSPVKSPLSVRQRDDRCDDGRQDQDVLSGEPQTDLDGRKQIQAQASDDVKTPDHVSEQVGYDRVMPDELTAGGRIARRRLFL
ncbi:hypothetical protein AUG86_03515 [Euryarchaeota archaeon 13_1_20CM_4_64_14]|nr:MAG: hypothetical protein AUG86_03515 [Euryarchaeota archaeon 13_1_20CM_4_64_14]